MWLGDERKKQTLDVLDGWSIKTATKLSLLELREAVQDRDVWRNLIMNVSNE